jgi:hypothetical protein
MVACAAHDFLAPTVRAHDARYDGIDIFWETRFTPLSSLLYKECRTQPDYVAGVMI